MNKSKHGFLPKNFTNTQRNSLRNPDRIRKSLIGSETFPNGNTGEETLSPVQEKDIHTA